MNPAIKITTLERLEISIPVEDFQTRIALAIDMHELVSALSLLRVYTITGEVICEASNKFDAEHAVLFAEVWLKARASSDSSAALEWKNAWPDFVVKVPPTGKPNTQVRDLSPLSNWRSAKAALRTAVEEGTLPQARLAVWKRPSTIGLYYQMRASTPPATVADFLEEVGRSIRHLPDCQETQTEGPATKASSPLAEPALHQSPATTRTEPNLSDLHQSDSHASSPKPAEDHSVPQDHRPALKVLRPCPEPTAKWRPFPTASSASRSIVLCESLDQNEETSEQDQAALLLEVKRGVERCRCNALEHNFEVMAMLKTLNRHLVEMLEIWDTPPIG